MSDTNASEIATQTADYNAQGLPMCPIYLRNELLGKEKRIALLSSEVMENARRVGKQQKHSDIATRCWIECLLKKAVDDLVNSDAEDEIEIDFSTASSHVAVTKEFHERDSCALRSLVKDEVVPYWVEYLLQLEASGDGDGDEFNVLGEDWFVDCVHISGERKMSRCRVMMIVKVHFKKMETAECCVSGDYFPINQMVTDGDGTYMYREIHENFE